MTTRIMESFDAQMLDYQNDLDVPMHISTSDSWFQDVIPMEDDGHLAFQAKGAISDPLPTIEVDMEAYIEDEHNEYEMLDDHHGQNLASGELLDVDVLDASAVPTPLVTVTPLPATPSVELPQPHPSADAGELSDGLSVLRHATDSSLPEYSEDVAVVGQTDAASSSAGAQLLERPTLLNDDNPEQLVSVPQASEETSTHDETTQQSAITQTTPKPDVNVPLQTDGRFAIKTAPITSNEDRADSHYADRDRQSTESVSSNSPHVGTSLQIVSAEPQLPEAESGEAINVTVEQLHPANAGDTEPPRAYVSDPDHFRPLAEPSNDPTNHLVTHEHDTNLQPAESLAEAAEGVINEISEEAHLETPPPVLLSIFSTEHPELCLFNKPTEPLPDEDDTQERHILFQQAISLFYDPLVNIFEALRQDEYVSTVLDVSGNELALDAYELGLSITEDNYYGREISLHDICALHASAGFHGPLRLRLYVIGTRFIVRFHALQEGLVNLQVDESQSSEYDSDHSQYHDPQDQETYQDDAVGQAISGEQAHLELPEDNEDHLEEAEQESTGKYEVSHDEDTAGPTEEPTGEIDLSTLPPFVDSPEAHEESDEEGELKLTDNTQPESVEVAPEEELTENIDEPEDDGFEDPDASLSNVPTNAQENESTLEEAASGVQEEYNLEYADGVEVRTQQEDDTTVNASEGQNEDTISSQPEEEQTEGTPQPELIDLANETPAELLERHSEVTETTEDSKLEHAEEAALDTRYGGNDPDTQEDIQDFGEDAWDDELDGEGEPDITWEAEKDNGNESISAQSSVTLSSKASKRSFDDFGLENSDDENSVSESPGLKRARVE